MAHEHIVRHGLIVENSFQFKDEGNIVTGITNTGTLADNPYKLVTENVIKSNIESITLGDLSGVSAAGAVQDNILVYSGGTWSLTTIGDISGDFYTKTE